MSLGAVQAGVSVVAAIDNDIKCKETYESNHPNSKFLHKDIKNMTPEDLENEGIFANDDNMIFIGCSPCQYWSHINGKSCSERKKTARPSRNLLKDFLHFTKDFRPGWVVVENVKGIIRNSKESGLSDLIDFFQEEEYEWDYNPLSFCKYGVPQTRSRFVLVASRVLNGKAVPFPTEEKKDATVREAIGELEEINAGGQSTTDPLHRSAGLSEVNLARLTATKEGCARESWAKNQGLQIDAYRDKDLTFFRENYGRMWWDKPAPTITTRFFSLSCGRFGHPKQNRALSLREGALLQTFPKSYKFKTTNYQDTARIIGNAVPPEFARRLFTSIVNSLDG